MKLLTQTYRLAFEKLPILLTQTYILAFEKLPIFSTIYKNTNKELHINLNNVININY